VYLNYENLLFHCDRYNTIRQQITSDIVLKYPLFDLLNDTDKTTCIFLFDIVDSFICKKLGYFLYGLKHYTLEKLVILSSLMWLVLM